MSSRNVCGGAAVAVVGLILTACTTTLGVKPGYVAAGTSSATVLGKVAIIMPNADREQVITAHPQSLTGGATSISLPIGAVIASVGDKVCSAYFSEGLTSDKPPTSAYAVRVKLDSFSYKYDQLSNLGFAITPKVSVAMNVSVTSPKGETIVPDRRYDRSDYSATGAYFVSLNPQEKINQSLHMAVGDIFREVMGEIPKTKTQSGD